MKTTTTFRGMVDEYVGTKVATDNFWDLSGETTTAVQFRKALLCLDITAGTAHYILGDTNTAQAYAEIPQEGLAYDWIPVGVVEIPNNYAGGAHTVFYDLHGEINF
jgi:hypothetical protein